MSRTYRIAAALLGLLVAGCASNPPILVALPDPPASVARPPAQSPGATLLLRQVTLPGYLDSLGVVVDRKANTLVVSEDAEWAERLRDAVTRTLRDALSQRLGASRVLLRGEHRIADAELVIEFLKLDPSDGILHLDARWSFVCSSRNFSTRAGRAQLQVPLEAATSSAVASATANALAKFADVLASQTWCSSNGALPPS